MNDLDGGDGTARLSPRLSDTQWFVLGRLRRLVEGAVSRGSLASTGRRIVDFGAGSAPYRPLFGDADYLTADLDGTPDLRFEPGGPLGVDAESVDAVVSFQVLEHVWDLDWYFAEARRILRPDGVLVLSTHGTWPYHPHPTDFRRWTRDGLVAEIETRGFIVERVGSVGGPLVFATLIRQLSIVNVLRRLGPIGAMAAKIVNIVFNGRLAVEDRITPSDLSRDNAIVYLVEARPQPKEAA